MTAASNILISLACIGLYLSSLEGKPRADGGYFDLEFDPHAIAENPGTPIPYEDYGSAQDEYRVKTGDIFLISVYGEDKTQREVIVDPRGMISYLFIDSLPVIGKTLRELREAIEIQLRSYYRYATLSITPIRFNAEYYVIAGEVNLPGRKPMVGRPTVLSAICQAEGFTTIDFREQLVDMVDLEKAFLMRNGDYVPVDFVKLVKHGDLSQNIPLERGDYIYIPHLQPNQVFVVGEVYGATTIDYLRSMSLVEAIAEAGDVTERASNRVVILRGSLSCPVRFVVDFERIVKGCAPDFPLCKGDIVYVPPRRFQSLRELFQLAARSFVGTVASEAGIETFIRTHPHARGEFSDRVFVGGSGVVVTD